MATADSTALGELLTKRFDKMFVRLVAQDSYIYDWLPKVSQDGDTEYLFKVHYAGSTDAGSYGENDDLGSADHQYYKPARVSVKQYKKLVQVSGLTIEATKGQGGYMQAWGEEITQGLEDLKTAMSDDILSASAPGNGGLDHEGVPYIIDDTGTYANIDSSTYTWWKSYVKDAASANLSIALMQDMTLNLRPRPRRARPSIIFTDFTQFNNYGNLLTGLRRYTPTEKLTGGFDDSALDFEGIPIVRVENYPANRVDFLDKRGWQYRTLLPFKSEPADAGNVDARRQRFLHYGMVVCKQRNRQGSLQSLA